MRTSLLPVAALLLLVSCGGSPTAPRNGGEPAAGVTYDSDHGQEEARGADDDNHDARGQTWILEKDNFDIDGEVLSAKTMVVFDSVSAKFLAVVSCKIASSEAAMSVVSLVDGSQNDFAYSYSDGPLGRVKAGESKVEPLRDVFSMDDIRKAKINVRADKLQKALMHALVERIRSVYGTTLTDVERWDMISWNGESVNDREKEMGSARRLATEGLGGAAVLALFPMSLEVSNSAGTFQMTLVASPEVQHVLRTCGGDDYRSSEAAVLEDFKRDAAARRTRARTRALALAEEQRKEEQRKFGVYPGFCGRGIT